MTTFRVRIPCADTDELVRRMSQALTPAGLFISTPQPCPVGMRARFVFLLQSGEPAYSFLGDVVASRAVGLGGARAGMTVSVVEVDAGSQHVHELLLQRARVPARPVPPPPAPPPPSQQTPSPPPPSPPSSLEDDDLDEDNEQDGEERTTVAPPPSDLLSQSREDDDVEEPTAVAEAPPPPPPGVIAANPLSGVSSGKLGQFIDDAVDALTIGSVLPEIDEAPPERLDRTPTVEDHERASPPMPMPEPSPFAEPSPLRVPPMPEAPPLRLPPFPAQPPVAPTAPRRNTTVLVVGGAVASGLLCLMLGYVIWGRSKPPAPVAVKPAATAPQQAVPPAATPTPRSPTATEVAAPAPVEKPAQQPIEKTVEKPAEKPVEVAAAPAEQPKAPEEKVESRAPVRRNKKKSSKASAQQCVANITSEPSHTAVWVGEDDMGDTPIRNAKVPCGAFEVTFQHAGYDVQAIHSEASPGTTAQISLRLTPKGSSSTPAP